MAELYYQGHGSFRLTTAEGKTVYVDPYAGDGYDRPADLILVTHDHFDHNRVDLVEEKKDGCVLFTHREAIVPEGYQTLDLGWIRVVPVKAQNKNHDPACCVGYLLFADGVSLWASGDTSRYEEMEQLKEVGLDWAVFPTDGKYNMGPEEAADCARLCGCAKAIPVHTDPESIYLASVAERFDFEDRVLVKPGETVTL